MKTAAPLAVLVIFIANTVPTFGQLREYPDESLTGLKAVHVIVQYQAPNEGVYGLTQQALQNAVEARLSADNVKVLAEKEWRKAVGIPYLFVNVVGD